MYIISSHFVMNIIRFSIMQQVLLVIGAGGLVGSNLIWKAKEKDNFKVISTYHNNPSKIEGTLCLSF